LGFGDEAVIEQFPGQASLKIGDQGNAKELANDPPYDHPFMEVRMDDIGAKSVAHPKSFP
jgi:hypothetical protein